MFVAAILPAAAQTCSPRRPVTIIVPYAPGGGTDTAARLMAARLERELNGTFQVVNRAGAASQIGLTALARAKPDGMTLAYAILPTVVTHYRDPKRQAPYTGASFQPIVTHYISTMTLSVHGDSPYRTLHDFVEAPGGLMVSDSGLLGTPHTTTLLLQGVTGGKFTCTSPAGSPWRCSAAMSTRSPAA